MSKPTGIILLFVVGYSAAVFFGYNIGAINARESVAPLVADINQHQEQIDQVKKNLRELSHAHQQEAERADALLVKNKQLTDTWQKLVFMLQQSCKQRERVVINGAEYHCHPAKTTPTLELQQPKRNQEDRA